MGRGAPPSPTRAIAAPRRTPRPSYRRWRRNASA
jgi:hypothetical protein